MLSLVPQAFGNECLAWLGIVTEPGKENEVLQSLKQRPEIGMNFMEMGKYNIRSVLAVRSHDELEPSVDSLKKIHFVIDIDVMIWTGIKKMAYPENLGIEQFAGDAPVNEESEQDTSEAMTSSTTFISREPEKGEVPFHTLCSSIDKVDERILNSLLTNARMPFLHVAKRIGISTKTVIHRYNRLKRKWVAYATLSLNLRKLGYSGYASYNIKVSSKSWVTEVFNQVTGVPNVISALRLVGPYNINALAPFSTPEKLTETYSRLSKIPGIERIDVQIGNSMGAWPGA
jgi:DNA-binding Lrp family transcriptional regulator